MAFSAQCTSTRSQRLASPQPLPRSPTRLHPDNRLPPMDVGLKDITHPQSYYPTVQRASTARPTPLLCNPNTITDDRYPPPSPSALTHTERNQQYVLPRSPARSQVRIAGRFSSCVLAFMLAPFLAATCERLSNAALLWRP